MKTSCTAYYIGIAIVVLSHLYIIVQGDMGGLSMDQHAWLNLVGAALIAWGWTQNCL